MTKKFYNYSIVVLALISIALVILDFQMLLILVIHHLTLLIILS